LLDSADLILEDEIVVEETFEGMAGITMEFADVFVALRNRNAGCTMTKTFDAKTAKATPGMELLA
jgi:predicted nucleic-acid-binding protein